MDIFANQNPAYYVGDRSSSWEIPQVLSGLGPLLDGMVQESTVAGGAAVSRTINMLAKTAAEVGIPGQVLGESVEVIIQAENNVISIGDDTFVLEQGQEIAIGAITSSLFAAGALALGFIPPGWLAVGVATTGSILLSYLLDTDQALETAANTVDVEFKLLSQTGDVLGGVWYRDGISSVNTLSLSNAIADFLSYGGDLTPDQLSLFPYIEDNMKVEYHYGGEIYDTFTIYDGQIIEDVAALFGENPDAFFSGSGGTATAFWDSGNSELPFNLYTEDQGQSWVFARSTDVLSIDMDNDISTPRVSFHPSNILTGLSEITGGVGTDLIVGTESNDLLTGGRGQDYVFGGAGSDELFANGVEGDFYYGGGIAPIENSNDSDTIYYQDVGFGITVEWSDIQDKEARVYQTSGLEFAESNPEFIPASDKLFSIEEFYLTESTDHVKIEALPTYDMTLLGFSGNDILDFANLNNSLSIVVSDVANLGTVGNISFDSFSKFITGSGQDYFLDASGSHFYDGGADLDEVDYSSSASQIVVSQHLGIVNTRPFLSFDFEKDFIQDIEGITGTTGNDYFYVREGLEDAFFDGNSNTNYIDANGNSVAGRDVVDFSYHDGNSDDLIGPPNPNANEGVTITLGAGGTGSGTDTAGGSFALVDIEEVIATNGNDVITASGGSNWLFGMAGEDVLSGGAGDDHISGGANDDQLDGGSGNDTYYFGWRGVGGIDEISDVGGVDEIYFMESYNFDPAIFARDAVNSLFKINGFADIDLDIYNESVVETVEYVDRAEFKTEGLGLSFHQDTTNGTIFVGNDFIDDNMDGNPDVPIDDNESGSANDDHLSGNVGNDNLSGGFGNDLLEGGEGSDTLNGGAGSDALYATGQGNNFDDGELDTLNGDEGNDFLYGSGGGDVLNGGDGYDYLSGKEGDVLNGGAGEDQLFGTGLVRMDGGLGNDYLSASGTGAIYVGGLGTDVILDNATNSVLLWENETLSSLDFGRAANDSLVITNDLGNSVVVLNHFSTNPLELINFGDDSIAISTIDDDITFFTPSVDDGSGDSVYPERTYTGGDEDNTYISTGANDTVDLGLGANSLGISDLGLPSRVFMFAEPDALQDTIKLANISSFDDVNLVLENGVMTLSGGLSQVVINDYAEVGQSTHIVVEVGSGLVQTQTLQEIGVVIKGSASGNLQGYSINDVMIADEAGSTIFGLSGDDQITGLLGDDTLSGGTGDDQIIDGDGDDIVYGDDGSDILIDQGGSDTYYVDVNDTLYAGAGANQIVLDWDSVDEQNGIPYSLTGFEIIIDNEDDFANLAFTRSFGVDSNGDIIGTEDIYTLNYAGNSLTIEDYEDLSGTPTITLLGTSEQEVVSNFTLVTDLSGFTDGEIVSEGAVQFGHDDLFYGTSGNDNLSFTGGVDKVYGGDGDDGILKTDSFYIDENLNLITIPHTANDTLEAYGEGGNDTIFGGLGDDILDGGSGDDFINGKEGMNTIRGGFGNDTLYPGSSGANIVDGGFGNDTLSFNPSVMNTSDSLTIDLQDGTVTSSSGVITISNIENVEGSANYDHIIGNDENNVLSAYSGEDLLEGKGGDDIYQIPFSGGMTIRETEGYDVIEAPLTVAQAQSALTVTVSDFDMILDTGASIYTIENQFSSDEGARVEAIQLLDGTLDLINFTTWYTTDTGGLPVNVVGTSASEPIIGTVGLFDTVDYSSSLTSLTVDLEVGIGTGGHADGDTYFSIENAVASAYNDIITGNSDINNLFGGDGDDILSGAGGNDYLEGGAGNDIYVFNIGDGINTILESSGFDTLSLGVGITFGDLTFNRIGDDLDIQIASGFKITDFYSGDSNKVVEQIEFSDGSTFDLTTLLNTSADGPDIIDLSQASFTSYVGSQDAGGTIEFIDSETGVEINGNAWKKIALDYDITANTVISFDFKSTILGEGHGITLDTNNTHSSGEGDVLYKLQGTDTYATEVLDFQYAGEGDWQSFTIDVGSYQTGQVNWLGIANDHDYGSQNATSFYRNFSIYEVDPSATNYAPVATNDVFEGDLDTAVTGNVLEDNWSGIDRDVDGDILTVVEETVNTANGSVSILSNGDFTYIPNTSFSGIDSFSYTINDGNGGSDTGNVDVYIDQSFVGHTPIVDGVTAAENLADPAATLNGLNEITIVAQVDGSTIGHDRGIFDTEAADGGDDALTMRYDANGFAGGKDNVIKVGLQTSLGQLELESAANVHTTDPQHLTITWKSGEAIKLYIDGVLTAASYNSPALGGTIAGVQDLLLGVGAKSAGGWDGTIDDFKIYDVALDAKAVNELVLNSTINRAPEAENDKFVGLYENDTTGNLIADNGFDVDSDLDNDTMSVVSGTFVTANGSIDISVSGDFTYTPNTGFLGVDSYTYTLQDGQGASDTATVSINVLQAIPDAAPQLDFTGETFLSYNGSQDAGGTISVIENGAGVEIEGNAWKKVALDYVVTQNTVINFEYKSENQGEVQGFGLETDDNFSTGANNFQLYGVDSPTSFIRDFDYVESKIFQSYSIDIGNYQTGQISHLVFVNDHDTGSQGGTSAYRNISIYEDGTVNDDTMNGSSFSETFIGRDGNDTLDGNGGVDTIFGGSGSDYLYGGDGDDLLYGGDGIDMLYGEGGADTFIFEAASAFTSSDNIQDFDLTQNDKLDISDLLEGYDPVTDAITDFVEITENAGSSYLSVDADGGGDNYIQVAYIYNETGLTDEDALETSGNLITV